MEEIDNRYHNNFNNQESDDIEYSNTSTITILSITKNDNSNIISFKYNNHNALIVIDNRYEYIDYKYGDEENEYVSYKFDGSNKSLMNDKLNNMELLSLKYLIEYFKLSINKFYEITKFLE